MANPLQFAYRTQKAIGIFDAAPVYEALPGFVKPEGNLRCCVYSPCGRYFAYASNEGVVVVDASVGHVLTSLPITAVYELGFSPRGTYLSTWERPAKDENGDATKNFKIWRTIEDVAEGAEKQPIGQFVQKSQSGWNLQYTADEKYCARLVTNEVQFYNSDDLSTVWNKLRAEGVTDFAIAPGLNQNVAVFIPERKGQPAAVKVYNVPSFNSPISQKTFFKGDKVQLKWNGLGTSLIVLAQTEVDKSNKSYYGETTMYLLSANGSFDARITLDKEGPIHDVAWSPSSSEFGVIYGFMPAKTTIFNHRGVAIHSFPIAPRNTIIFSPTGRFALVAGFGNLAGQIDVYDLEKDYRKICTIESGNPSVCTWSPDSRYIMTATTSPRLRVDNGIKLWHVGGGIMYSEDMVELYNVVWRPVPTGSLPANDDPLHPLPTPHASAVAYLGTVKTPSKPVGAYRPPGARGALTPLHFKREDEGGAAHSVSNGIPGVGPNGFGRARHMVPGAEPATVPGAAPADDGALSKSAAKNKKKRNKKAKEGGDANASAAPGGAPADGGLAPSPREYGSGSGTEGRSPDRRGHHHQQHQQQHPHQQGHHARSRSRQNNGGGLHPPAAGGAPGGPRNRSNTHRGGDRARSHSRPGHHHQHQQQQHGAAGGQYPQQQQQYQQQQQPQQHVTITAPPPTAPDAAAPGSAGVVDAASANPNAKKMRALQKKIRAIEDLEMRMAGGEKLEDTQVKKIATKAAVLRELEGLEREG